jgi:hypothetical protein
MTLHQWLGLPSFRKGKSVKPDKNRRTEDWPNITQGGSS